VKIDRSGILIIVTALTLLFVMSTDVQSADDNSVTSRSVQYAFTSLDQNQADNTGMPEQPLGAFSPTDEKGYWGVKIGETWWENQRNGSMRRMIATGFDYSAGWVHFTWMYLPTSVPYDDRTYRYNSYDAAAGTFLGATNVHAPHDQYGGFTVIDITNDHRAIVGGHLDIAPPGPYQSHFFWDYGPGFGFFSKDCRVPDGSGSACEYVYNPNEDGFIWPAMCWKEGSDTILHVFALENNHTNDYPAPGSNTPKSLAYFRTECPEEVAGCTWDDPLFYCVDTVYTFAHDCDCNEYGKVAIAWIANVQDPSDPCGGGDTCSSTGFVADPECDNDVYYQISNDGGLSWLPRVNITKNIYDADGYRPYTDLSVLIGSDNNTHVVWNARNWHYNDPQRCDKRGGRIFHYSENLPLIRTVHRFEWEQTHCDGGAWNLNACKMTLSECDGKLYCLFVQFNDIPNGIYDDCASGYFTGGANGDLYVSISNDLGLTWDYARNLTNTYTPACDTPDCESEIYPSMVKFGTDYTGTWPSDPQFIVDPSSSYTGDWFLDVQYINDNSPGCIVQTEGYWSIADVKWFRLACVEPVPNPIFVPIPNRFTIADLPRSIQLDTPLIVENIGNAALTYTISVEEDTGPSGWLGYAGFSGSVSAGASNADTGTVIINQGGIVQTSTNLLGRLIFTSNAPSSPDTVEVDVTVVCYADGDVDGNGMALTVGDLTYLVDYLMACGPAPDSLFKSDLNGDCVIDTADAGLIQCYFVYGMACFPQYPVPTCCDPTPEPIPDTVWIFGLEHVSGGTACYETTGGVLNVSRIAEEPCDTLVDANGDTIIVIHHPPKAPSGGGPFSSSMSNLEDAGIAWSGDYEEDTTLEATASLQLEVYGVVNGDSDQFIASAVQTKQADDSWALGVKAPVTSYTVTVSLGRDTVWSQSGIPASNEWFQTGRIYVAAKSRSDGPYSSSVSNLEDAGIIAIGWESQDTIIWNWPSEGVSDLEITKLTVDGHIEDQINVSDLSYIVQYAMDIPSYTITSESQTIDYGGIAVTNLGNAILTPAGTTLIVSNITSTGNDGIDAEADADDGEWSIMVANPNLSDTWPVGASLGVEYFFAADTGDAFSMESFFDFAGSNTWNLGVSSNYPLYTVEAYNNETSVFSAEGVAAADLGYVVETAKGVHPVGFRGGTTGKPAKKTSSCVWHDPDGVQWTWAAQGVSGLTIDYLCVTSDTTVAGNNPIGPYEVAICGSNGGAKSEPISFTILDIEVTTSCCQNRGNADGIIGVGGPVDVADLTYLVKYLFKSGPVPPCIEEGNVDGITGVGGPIDVADLTYLVKYLFKSGPAPAPCP